MSHSCIFNPKNLQHEFSSHAAAFGIAGQWNKANADLFKQAIQDHITQASLILSGTFRSTRLVTHYYNPTTQLWAAVDLSNTFVAGWKLSLVQEAYLLATGNIQ